VAFFREMSDARMRCSTYDKGVPCCFSNSEEVGAQFDMQGVYVVF
jgi:hypothetical protein